MKHKDTYIGETCQILNLTKKQLSAKFNKTQRTIDNWCNNPEMIPLEIKECLDALRENVKLNKKIEALQEVEQDILFVQKDKSCHM